MPNPLKLLDLKHDGFQFIQEVKIAAPPAKVWKSLLNVAGWWEYAMLGKGSKLKLESRAGGRFFESHPDGREALHAIVNYLEPNKLLRLGGPLGISHLPVSSVYIFELQPQGKGTLLRFCQRTSGHMTPELKENFQSGWPGLFKSLKKLAEEKPGR